MAEDSGVIAGSGGGKDPHKGIRLLGVALQAVNVVLSGARLLAEVLSKHQ